MEQNTKYRVIKTTQGFKVERQIKICWIFKWWVNVIIKTSFGYNPIYFSDLETAEDMIKDLKIENASKKQVVREYD